MRSVVYIPLLLMCFTAVVLCSCASTQKAVYFNGVGNAQIDDPALALESPIQKNDILSITVSSPNPEAAAMFNTPNAPSSGLMSVSNSTVLSQSVGYLVNESGNIQFLMLGDIKAEGRTKKQLADDIAGKIRDKKLLLDPVITIRQLNFHVTVLGEVARPSVFNVPNEKISILEAIGMAGDLTIFARRDNVLLIREENGKKTIQRLNLNNGDIFNSPYYYLRSNDIVYAEPNKTKISSVSQTRQNLPLILSGLSIIAVIATRIIK